MLRMVRSRWSTPEWYVRRRAMWSGARFCLAEAETGGDQMLRFGMAGSDVRMQERYTLLLHTQQSAPLSYFIFFTRAYPFFGCPLRVDTI